MRPRVVLFAALCLVAVAAILWLALGGREEAPTVAEERKPAVVARQVDRAPTIGTERRDPAPAEPEPAEEISPDDAPVIEGLDILEMLARSPE